MNKLLSLRELLETLPFDHHVLLPSESKWHLDTLCAIVESDDDEITEPENHPLALENKFSSSIGTNEVLDIIANAREQIPRATVEQLLAAFEFYYDNDAFIEFEEAR